MLQRKHRQYFKIEKKSTQRSQRVINHYCYKMLLTNLPMDLQYQTET